MPTIITIVGKSKSGKTTLIEKLLPVLKKKGYKIGTIKHAHHGFDIDQAGKDSYRHKKAGADAVVLSSPSMMAMVKDQERESIEQLSSYLKDMDLILIEGFKNENQLKIEIFRKDIHKEPLCIGSPMLIAFVTDAEIKLNIPVFALDDIDPLAAFIEEKILFKM